MMVIDCGCACHCFTRATQVRNDRVLTHNNMFLHNYHPTPYLLDAGFLKIHWYGFLMVIGGVAGLLLVLRLAKYYSIKRDDIFDMVFYWVVFAVIGARVYYVLYAWEFYKNNLPDIFKIWHGGLAVHGIMIGGFVAAAIFAWRKKINVWRMLDLAAIGLCAAQIVGRWGNYFNQEIFGKPTALLWGIPIDPVFRPVEYSTFQYFHPTVLYESLGSVLILAGLLTLFLKIAAKKNVVGIVFASYLMLYSVLRFALEFLRIDYSQVILGVRWPQIFSALLFIVGVALIFKLLKRRAK
jgi:phosphatidylglycerol:prolipoprotein diacylglycerol transferase